MTYGQKSQIAKSGLYGGCGKSSIPSLLTGCCDLAHYHGATESQPSQGVGAFF